MKRGDERCQTVYPVEMWFRLTKRWFSGRISHIFSYAFVPFLCSWNGRVFIVLFADSWRSAWWITHLTLSHLDELSRRSFKKKAMFKNWSRSPFSKKKAIWTVTRHIHTPLAPQCTRDIHRHKPVGDDFTTSLLLVFCSFHQSVTHFFHTVWRGSVSTCPASTFTHWHILCMEALKPKVTKIKNHLERSCLNYLVSCLNDVVNFFIIIKFCILLLCVRWKVGWIHD